MAMVKGIGNWVKVLKPVPTYDKTKEEWTLDLIIDKEVKKYLAGLGLGPKIKTNKNGDDFIKFSKKTTKADGTPSKAVEVVGRDGKPWDGGLIGNGSTLNIKFMVGDNNLGGKKVNHFDVQVWDHVEYEGAGGGEEFPVDSSGAEAWD